MVFHFSLSISISLNFTPSEKPVPIALDVASLAENLEAILLVYLLFSFICSISFDEKILDKNLSPNFEYILLILSIFKDQYPVKSSYNVTY